MGERKGQNFYYPPDFDYKKHKSLNKYHGTHALRERAKKISQGILVIRFEMPFNIWCLGCNNHVGMGVRYNAEKKKIGMYYTTPLYEFRMKCHLCDNYYVIRTDPKNFDYELVEGCTRQEKRFEPSEVDQVDTSDSAFSHKLAADAMFKTEHLEEDKGKATNDEVRMEKIEWVQERLRDDFAANQALRAQFRKEKRELNERRAKDADLRSRCSLSIPLAPEDPNDKRVAEMLLRYRGVNSHDEQEERRNEAAGRRIFPSVSGPSTSKVEQSNLPSAERLKVSIRRNRDRQINEKFDFGPAPKKSPLTLGIVRKSVKREAEGEEYEDTAVAESSISVDVKEEEDEKKVISANGLVADYDSSGSE
ncbi:Galactosylgalactosylxylosylprotein 3-beta-glucuronosyltransferase [Trichostrongylus colubriformis]|uniref:Galactosylgalactosylxylosylprotein 3-beta-glucuronosyltransferase n=1 Tax=Trichostrongylus colubriformis TaxID=6319 RepID=A0AAN8F017_TRICO